MATLCELRSGTLYDFEIRAIQQQRPGVPRSEWPTFLVQTLGPDFFHDIYAVNSADQPPDRDGRDPPDTTDNDRDRFWDCVTQFPHLRQLCVAGGWMDPSGLARLRNRQDMEILTIADFPLTDDDLKVIGSMIKLKTLRVDRSHCPITDEGIAALDNLSDLEAFALSNSQITDGAAEHLAKHPKMANLQLVTNRLTDRSTPYLAQLSELSYLALIDMEIGDHGCQDLKSLPKLEYLTMNGTNITDEGLMHLAQLSSLKDLTIRQTKVTPTGVARFKARLPTCTVYP